MHISKIVIYFFKLQILQSNLNVVQGRPEHIKVTYDIKNLMKDLNVDIHRGSGKKYT